MQQCTGEPALALVQGLGDSMIGSWGVPCPIKQALQLISLRSVIFLGLYFL